MTDASKRFQRNIRIPDDLWAYVQSQAQKGHARKADCSAVIRAWIHHRMRCSEARNRRRQ